MEWTPAQQQVLDGQGGRCLVVGPAGSGKTTVLVERWRRRAEAAGPERLLVLCSSRAGAERFRRAAAPEGSWASAPLPITSWYGAAFDVVLRHRGDRHLLTRTEQWTLVRRLISEAGPSAWPSCAELAGRAAFVDEVAAAVLAVEAAAVDDDSILQAAEAAGQRERWSDLLSFCGRYRLATAGMGAMDGRQLFAEATEVVSDGAIAAGERARWAEVLIDDAETMAPLAARWINELAPDRLTVAGNADGSTSSPRRRSPNWFDAAPWDAIVELALRHRPAIRPARVRCQHPSIEPEAIAGILLETRQAGVAWEQMAVLVSSERQRAQAVGRALARHGIPVRATPGAAAAEPAVRAITGFFAWAAGDDSALETLLDSPALDLGPGELRRLRRAEAAGGRALTDDPRVVRLVELRNRLAPQLLWEDPARLAHTVWVSLLGGLVPAPGAEKDDPTRARALDAVVAFLAGLSERVARDPSWRIADEMALMSGPDFDPEPWRAVPGGETEAVTLTSVAAAAGREWDTVVIAGCVEGELPHISASPGFFDPAVPDLATGDSPRSGGLPTLADRRVVSLEAERRLFALAASRATRRLLVTAAPRPGERVSRFVAGAQTAPVRLFRPQSGAGTLGGRAARETPGLVPVHPGAQLALSASQLLSYDDCPLRYFYQYALGVRGVGGVSAAIGTLVHAVLARFLDPGQPPDRSWPALEGLAEARWSDGGLSESIAPYQPMREQARRDIFTMLHDWWEAESAGGWPDVLAVEYPFDIAVGEHRVRGSIDRVDRVPGGIGIVDYKTGSRVARPEEVVEDLQLATYHLAAVVDPQLAALGTPVTLRLCYLRSGEQRAQTITAGHASHTEQRILEAAARILSEDFDPSVEADCELCDFRRLCPLQVEGRQVGCP